MRWEFAGVFLAAFIILLLFETGAVPAGIWADDEAARYCLNVTGIALVIIFVPVSLKFPFLRFVKHVYYKNCRTREQINKAYIHVSEVQMGLLAVAGWANLLFYYLTLDTTGSFCAAIVGLSLLFCVPSERKMEEAAAEKLDIQKIKGKEA